MAKLGSVLERQFKKLGIEITDDLKPLIELDTEITDKVADTIDKGLLTIEAAKINPDVKNALKAQTLAGADAQMDELIKEMGLTVDEDFANEKNTYAKIPKLAKLLHEAGKKKGEGANKENVSEVIKQERTQWTQKEAEFQKQLKQLNETLAAKETEFKTTREGDLTAFEVDKILLGKKYVLPEDMDSSIKIATARGALNKDLQSKGLYLRRNEAGQLVITDKDGQTAYSDKHEKIDNPNNYIDGVLTQNKLLKINDASDQQQNSQQHQNGMVNNNNQQAKGNQAIANEIQLF